ncbi:glutathione S-transferase family protein [Acidocella sp.]|uniref:glutathione S-transferase family protein n=1 Tax=Acidocella sp. TaxID=50710 RepID=UPI00260AC717|nr:glutathione S-transferase family protein [Acidocella sp.]
MLTIHHLGMSQSERIIWLCEELGLPYELIRYEREPSMAAPPAYKALHPTGTAPIITDGDVTLAETGAIVEYIARRHAGGRLLLGPDDAGFAPYLFWLHYANGSILPAFMMDMTAKRLGAEPASARTDIAFALAEQRLGEADYFAGDEFTAADILMGFPLTRLRAFSRRDISGMPNIRAYLQRIGARPAFQAAMAKAEPGHKPNLD